MALKLITPPSVEPVSLTEVKAHLRVDHSDDDTLITALIKAARERIDTRNGLQRALVSQTWDLFLDSFPGAWWCDSWSAARGGIVLPFPPVRSVTGVYYRDSNGVEQTVSSSNYTVDDSSEPGRILPIPEFAWPCGLQNVPNAVRVRFVCGYAPSTDSPPDYTANVPAPIKAALKMTIGHLYANRESIVIGGSVAAVQVPQSAEWLLEPFKVFV